MTSYDQMSAAERRIATYVCETYVEDIIKANNGLTMGGATIAEKFTEQMNKLYIPNNPSISVAADALRHWVTAAGYNNAGEYEYYLSNHRIG